MIKAAALVQDVGQQLILGAGNDMFMELWENPFCAVILGRKRQ